MQTLQPCKRIAASSLSSSTVAVLGLLEGPGLGNFEWGVLETQQTFFQCSPNTFWGHFCPLSWFLHPILDGTKIHIISNFSDHKRPWFFCYGNYGFCLILPVVTSSKAQYTLFFDVHYHQHYKNLHIWRTSHIYLNNCWGLSPIHS